MQNLILPMDNNLSLAANGLLTSMVNCPEKDYHTIYGLSNASNDDFETIKKAVHELLNANYLVRVGRRFAVNKNRIPEMKVIKSAESIVRTYHVTADEHEKLGF